MVSKNSRFVTILGMILALVVTAYAADSRTKLKPGWNLFSPQQDIEMGRESAKQAEMQLPLLNDRQATSYIDTLGKQLASHAPGEKYPYQFKIVNDAAINAFALPGGFIYVNRGAIEAADSENQIAGVMAHEIGHVVLRHGTNQVSKAYLAQAPLAILGGVLGSNSIGSVLAQLGVGFGLNSLFLKYSRPADTRNGKPAPPSGRLTSFNGNGLQFRYPDNWRQYGQGSAMTIAPDGGIVNDSLAYGMVIAEFEPDYHGQGPISLEEANDQLLNNLQRSNANMRVARSHERTRVDGQAALIAEASNQSPAGGRETDWIVTTIRPDGTMYYFVGVAPQNEFNNYLRAFENVVDTVKFK